MDGLHGDDADFEGFINAMQSYASWRRRGGYEPMVGDKPGDLVYASLGTRYGVLTGNRDAVPDLP